AVEPVMLLLDEPFSALDALTRSRLQDELLQLQRQTGTTLLFVTHDIPEAVKLGSAILVLSPHPGQIKALLDPGRVSSQELTQTISRLIHADSGDLEQESN
ncbi:MAG: ABC transporter ATP-binding protein, partial [Pseudomonadales bacterium]|nr:ABC transporter ATP-binding protein [Pseudomonadales bacterium]